VRSPIIPARREEGAALLTVLLLVAVMAVITAIALERLTIATRMAQNGVGADQGRAFLLSAETLVGLRLSDLVTARPGRTTLAGGWLGKPQAIPVSGGMVTARVRDAGNCFNVNSLVEGNSAGSYAARASGIAQFAALLRLLGTDPRAADQIATSGADWIDSDQLPAGGGAEDAYYLQQPVPYRTAGDLLADPSELRTVNGMTAAIYDRVRPWLCALPVTDLSPINVNTLLPDQAILLAMLADGRLGPDIARQVLAQRPADGYGSLVDFWGQPALTSLGLPADATGQTKLTSRWFEVDLRADLGGAPNAGADVSETALFDAEDAPARLIRRRWGDEG